MNINKSLKPRRSDPDAVAFSVTGDRFNRAYAAFTQLPTHDDDHHGHTQRRQPFFTLSSFL